MQERFAVIYVVEWMGSPRERYFPTLTVALNFASRITTDGLTDRMMGIADRNELQPTVGAQGVALKALMGVARINGLTPLKAGQRAPLAREPITEIRRIVVEPDGREWEY